MYVEQPWPEGTFVKKRGRVSLPKKNGYQMYARALPKPPGARDCSRRASQSRKSWGWGISHDFSDGGVIDGWRG